MNLICHNTNCGYCLQERCARPVKVINERGLCDFLYQKTGMPRPNPIVYDDKEEIVIIDVEPIETVDETSKT